MSEGLGVPRTEAEGELAVARLALDGGDLQHAARHVGSALAADPSFGGGYQLLDELLNRCGPGAIALFQEDGEQYIGSVAAVAHLHARSGDYDQAVNLLGAIVRAAPGTPWALAPWFNHPDVAGRVSPPNFVGAVAQFMSGLPDPAPAVLVPNLMPFLAPARAIVARAGNDPMVPVILSGLARRLGAVDEAIAWCEHAERIAPIPNAAIMLGYALRSARRPEEAIQAWERAVLLDPANVDVYVDIAELHASMGQFQPALDCLDRARAVDSSHPKPLLASHAFRFELTGDVGNLVDLADYARAHPDEPYPRTLLTAACAEHMWLSFVPGPTEALADMLRQFLADRPRPVGVIAESAKVTLSGLEAPSAARALHAVLPNVELTIGGIPEPDMRAAPDGLRYRLWSYHGTDAIPVVAPPSPHAAEVLRRLARHAWSDPLTAYDHAVGFAALPLEDLLGLLAHPPETPDDETWTSFSVQSPMYWPRFAQVWTCLGLLHHQADEPWEGSTRRAVLTDLLHGVEDWTVDAAGHALSVAAWVFPEIRADVAHHVSERYVDLARAAQSRPCELHDPMAHLILTTPAVHPEIQSLARDLLAVRAKGQEPES